MTNETWTGHTPFGDAEGAGVAKEAGDAEEAGVAMGVEETGDCREVARLVDAGEAGVAGAGVKETEGETTGEDGNDESEDGKWMRLVAQLTDGLCWRNQLIPNTADTSGSNGVTRKVTGMV